MRRITVALFGALILAGGASILRERTAAELGRLDAAAGESFIPPANEAARRSLAAAASTYGRSMTGKLFDPLVGRWGGVLAKIGFVECTDVPVRAYQAAGVPIKILLRRSASEHPEWFETSPDNLIGNRLFFHRAWNYLSLFRNHTALTVGTEPQTGDWVFYGKKHVGLVIETGKYGNFLAAEASPVRGRVVLSDAAYLKRVWGSPTAFGRLKQRDAPLP